MRKLELNRPLSDKIITLKPLISVDINPEYLANMANDYNIAKYVGHRFPYPYSKKDAHAFLKYAKKAWELGSEYNYGIFISKNIYIGNIGITEDRSNNIVTNLGYWLGKDFEGYGYMTKSVALLSDLCFKKLGLRKIEANVYEGNTGSAVVLKKNGFEEEGVLKKHVKLKDGTILDKIMFGKINPNFKF